MPKSKTSFTICLLGLAAFVAALCICKKMQVGGGATVGITLASYAFTIALLEALWLKTPFNPSTGLEAGRFELNIGRSAVKLVGVYGSYAFVALLYWIFPEYHGTYYNPYWAYLKTLLPVVFIAAVPYVLLLDAKSRTPEDSYWQFGCLILGRKDKIERRVIIQHLLGWVIKGFFLPLMLVGYASNINALLQGEEFTSRINDNFLSFFYFSQSMLFTVDLLVAVTGYTLSLRLFDTHIRSSESTLFGWIICIICYQPFQSVVMRFYFGYRNNNWVEVIDDPTWQVVWGSIALIMLSVYTLASVNFGCRFSNLTNRGILTNGMYRITKHPAYVSKNIFWWMTAVPFFPAVSLAQALQDTVLILLVNLIYYLRARTEERHLSSDPDYVKYALQMNDKSIFAWLGHLFPALKYKAPTGSDV